MVIVKGRREYVFVITNHVRERFVERFSRESRYFGHLSRCRRSCDVCRDLTYWLAELVEQKKETWDKIISAKLHDADDVKIFNNNESFMEQMYSKYGYHRYRFLVEREILFVIRESEGENIVLTCMDVNNPVNGSRIIADFVHRPKYKKHYCRT